MIQIVCTNCKKPLSLDETKLPMKEVSFPCPACQTQLAYDRRDAAPQVPRGGIIIPAAPAAPERRYQTSPRSENRPKAAPPAEQSKPPVAERAPAISVQCTSCKTGLEIEEDSLSSRGPTSLRCPSCGVTLTIDKRSLRPRVTGPVVKVANEGYKPVPPPPPGEALADAFETGEYAQLLAGLYTGAEEYLHDCTDIKARGEALRESQQRGDSALRSMAVAPPQATPDDAREAEARPELRTIDGKLITHSSYLHQVSVIAETATRLHPHLRAPHRYDPLVEWQKATYATLMEAYEAAAAHSPQLPASVARLRATERSYADACELHQSDRRGLESKLVSQAALITKLETDIEAADKVVAAHEETAANQGKGAVPAGGCVGLVAAVVLGTVVANAANSQGPGAIAGLVALAAAIYLAYQIGYAKNSDTRANAKQKARTLRGERNDAQATSDGLRTLLDKHLAMAPDVIEKAVPPDAWSLMSTTDVDERRESLVMVPRIAATPHIPIRAVAAAYAETEIDAPLPVMGSASVYASADGMMEHRTVGFRTGGGIPPASAEAQPAAMPGFIAPPYGVPIGAGAQAPAMVYADSASRKKRTIVISVAAAVVVIIAAVITWQMAFSLSAKMRRALDHNDLYAPAGASLYDLYAAEQSSNPASSVLAEFKPKIRDKIEPPAEDAFARWYKDSDDTVSWESLDRAYGFLTLMFPDVVKYKTRRLYAVAQQAINSRDYAKAISSYEEALRLDPSWALALNGIGKVYMIDSAPMKNERVGVDYYERACAADPNFTWAPKNLADYYLRKDQYSPAEQYSLKALATSPERPSILRTLGYICRKTNRPGEAIRYYKQSMLYEKDPGRNAVAQKAIDSLSGSR